MAEELKKIDLNTATDPLAVADNPNDNHRLSIATRMMKLRKFKKLFLIPLGFLIVLAVLLGLMLLPLRSVISRARWVMTSGRELAGAIKSQDLEKSKTALWENRKQLTSLNLEYKKLTPLTLVPILGAYVGDGQHAINAGFAGLDAVEKAIAALEPNADLLGLKGKSTFVQGNADERIQIAVKTMNILIPQINEMATSVDTLRREIDAIDPDRYPEKIGKTVLRSKLVATKELINNWANLFVNAQPLLVNLPKMLGEPNERRYLVLFQNDKELRATGGFITAYAQFRLVRGKAILERSDDIYALDAAKRKSFSAPPEILKFHKNVYNLNLRDSNLSPDFKLSMQKFMELYETVSGREKIDGIWAVDTHVLVEALKILGPSTVYGREFSSEVDKRCDCPKAVYELEDYSTRPVGYVREARKDIIGVLLHSILQKALGVSPSKYWGQLFQMILTEINQKHVLAYFVDPAAQKAAESFNLAGRVMTASDTAALMQYKEGNGWDYLHINQSNMGGAKANMFVSSKFSKDTKINNDGTLTTKLTIEYKNPYPGSDCGLESGGLCLNAPLRNWIRIYVPLNSKLLDSQGAQSVKDAKPVALETYDGLNKTVFEGFLIVNPLGTAKLELSYTSPVKSNGKYRLLLQKQPGTDGQEVTLKIDGKDRKKFNLTTDIEIVL